jgi:pyruvate-ferredoxin/flavodoxin oxidoreductase
MKEKHDAKYPGNREAMDGNTAVIMCEREASDAAGAYPITPSTQMGEFWAEAAAAGHINVSGRPLIFIEPEGEHAAAAVTAGLSMTGLRSCNFSSGQGIAYMHESLYAAVGKRLTYVLNVGCRAMTKSTLNVHAGHDDYHAVDDTGFFQVMGKNVQEVCDLNIMAHRIAELSLNPGIVGQDGFLTTHLIESLMLPERDLVAEYLGYPDDIIETPTPAQEVLFGPQRRRIPELWDVDNSVMAGTVQNQDAYMQSVAAQRPFFFDHVAEIADQAMEEFTKLTGRPYRRVSTYRADDADYILLGQGSVVPTCEVVADYLRETRGVKVGVVNLTMFRPFPGDMLAPILKGKKAVCVLERLDQPLAEDLPVMREVRASLSKCIENGRANGSKAPYPKYDTFKNAEDLPALFSASFGMGSRDTQPESVIGAVENMLPDGKQRKMFYIGIDFIREKAFTPKQEVYQQQITEGYPEIKDLAVRGSENPNLMPDGAITARFHSIGGWGAITTGKNLAMTLFDLLGYHIKANPKYGSEKKGQPTTFYLSAAPEPIRVNCEYVYVDVVLSPDPNVFNHTNALAGLKKGGVFIIQSDLDSPEEVWREQIPPRYQQMIIENEIRIYFVDGFKIARDIATNPELEFRMQGIAFMGAFFAASPVMKQADLTDETLIKAIESQLEKKFGSKGRRIVDDNLEVVKRGFTEVQEVTDKKVLEATNVAVRKEVQLPIMLKEFPAGDAPATDVHRFWEQTGHFYQSGLGNENLTDPFMAMSLIPASTGVFRDMTGIRFNHPNWIAEKCTGCGNCWTVCPDSAIPGLVNTISEVLDTAVTRIEKNGVEVKFLRRVLPTIERDLRDRMNAGSEEENTVEQMAQAVLTAIDKSTLRDADKESLEQEADAMMKVIREFKFANTRPFFGLKEKDAAGSGGLLSITVDPYTCKGCEECVSACPYDALEEITQTPDTVERLRRNWEFWMTLPNTKPDYIRIDDLEEGVGALDHMLLDKSIYKSMVCGDGACLGCGEKTVMRLFLAANDALMLPRVKKHVAKLEDLIARLEKHVRLRMAESVDMTDTKAMNQALETLKGKDLTLSNLTAALDEKKVSMPLDSDWLKRTTQILAKLRHLHWQYTQGKTGRGRANCAMTNATGCTSVWGSTFPYNPYPFPWANHLFQDAPSLAMGAFEGHMAKMADGFKAVRMAEMELNGGYKPAEHEASMTYFSWKDFTDEEYYLCPPVIVTAGDGALYDIGFQNLSRLMMSGKPIKVLCLDTQVYSNTGGQACTSGFYGQVSDMAQYGKAIKGKEEIRKEIGLIAMAHRTSYVLQGTIANPSHLLEGFLQGFMSKRPALFNIYAPCMPEHGIGDDMAKYQSKLAVESRAYPVFRYNPDNGTKVDECLDLEGNPAVEDEWQSYTLSYVDGDGNPAEMTLPCTFADFALSEARFRKHFKQAPRDTWNDDMVHIAEFLALPADDRDGKFPFVWAVDRKGRLNRVLVSEPIVASTEDRANFWKMLQGLLGVTETVDTEAIAQQARTEVVQKLTQGLLDMAGVGGNGGAALQAAVQATAEPAPALAVATAEEAPAATPAADAQPEAAAPSGGGAVGASNPDYVPPQVISAECTGCGECVMINPKAFAWNDKKQAYLADVSAATYKELVKAAEKCAARCIKPGTPADMSEKGAEKLMKRAAKFND